MTARSLIEQVAADVASFETQRPPPELLEAARKRVFDIAGATLAGRDTATLRVMDAIEVRAGGGMLGAIRKACASARASEVDDIDRRSCITPGAAVVPVALLLGRAVAASGRQRLEAVLAGYDAMSLVGQAIDGATRIYAGVWPSYVAAPLGAAATAARVLGLDAEATAHALAIGAARTAGRAGAVDRDPTARWLLFGCACVDGVLAALAAAHGARSDPSTLDAALASAAEVDALRQPHRRSEIASSIVETDAKPCCTARQLQSAIEAVQDASAGLDHREVAAVELAVPEQYRAMVDRGVPADRARSIASAQYQLAIAITQPEALFDVARQELMTDSETMNLITRISVVSDARLTALYPDEWPARVTLTTIQGTTVEVEIREPFGGAGRPLGWTELIAKYRAIGAFGERLATIVDEAQRLGDEASGDVLAAIVAG